MCAEPASQPSDTETPPLVIPLDRLTAGDGPVAGGKAVNLALLSRAGLPVPRGFVVTTPAFHHFLVVSHAAEFCAALEQFDPSRPQLAAALAARARDALLASPIPDSIAQAVVSAAAADGPDAAYAVRSSATAEDLPDASFAGQHESFLNVVGPHALLDAVRACWASLFTERAVLYRARIGVDPRRVAMAVIVQEFIAADAAGVVFTADPVTGCTERIICETVFGLGEALVSGKVTPDRAVLDRATLDVLEAHAAPKTIMVVAKPAGGVCEQPVPGWQRESPCLSPSATRHLTELALRVEHVSGCPQDIEWALRGDELVVLQSRPITVAAPPPPAKAPAPPTGTIVWSNVNVGELLPDVATPMTFSVIYLAVLHLFGPLLKRIGIDLRKEHWFDLIAGRLYANVSVFTRLISALPATSHLDLTTGFGGYHDDRLPAALGRSEPVPWWQRLRTLTGLGSLLLWCAAHSTSERTSALVGALHKRVDGFVRVDWSAVSDERLCNYVQSVLRDAFRANNSLTLAAMGVGMLDALFAATRRWLNDEHGRIANRLLSGAGGMASAEAGLDLWRLTTWARAQPSLLEDLQASTDFATIRQKLTATDPGRAFLVRWEAWMVQHGHHTDGELDVYRPRWSETPDYVLGLLRGYLSCDAATGPLAAAQRRRADQARLLAECGARLGFFKRLVFERLLIRARRAAVLRENFKSEAVRVVAATRRALLELGARLARRGLLQERDDIFFLRCSELTGVQRGEAGFDVRATIAARRAEYTRNCTLNPPPVIIGTFEPGPAQPSATETNAAPAAPGTELHGLPVSAGVALGPARVMLRPDGREPVRQGDILVIPFADPGWTPHFLPAAGIVMDLGGLLSHGCIVAREYGIPAVVNVGTGTRTIRTGDVVRVDGDRGVVTIVGSGTPVS